MTTPDLVQTYNSRADRYVKVNRASGTIVGYSDTPSPFADVPVVAAPSFETLVRELHDMVYPFGTPIPPFDQLNPLTKEVVRASRPRAD